MSKYKEMKNLINVVVNQNGIIQRIKEESEKNVNYLKNLANFICVINKKNAMLKELVKAQKERIKDLEQINKRNRELLEFNQTLIKNLTSK